MSDVTRILEAIDQGNIRATEKLLPVVYEELRRLARHKIAGEKPGQTLQPTALVHEAYVRLIGSKNQQWENSRHFFSAAAEAMRRILIDIARKKRQPRRGGGINRVELDLEHVTDAVNDREDIVVAVHEALEKLAQQDFLKSEIVKLRYFGGYKHRDIAVILDVSESTVRRSWAYARSWLYLELTQKMAD